MSTPLEAYIRQAAQKYGIDPNVAVKVASGEGGLQDPFRRGQGPAPRTQASGFGATENSYGPFQLYVSGTGAGLGDRALAAGIDPTKNWQGGVDYALQEAAKKGWGQWYGAKAQGITGMMGINGSPYGGMADGPKGQEAYAPPVLGPTPQQSPLGIPQDVAQYAASDANPLGTKLQSVFRGLSNFPDAPAVRFGPMGDARNSGGDLLKALNAPTLSDLLSKKRLVG